MTHFAIASKENTLYEDTLFRHVLNNTKDNKDELFLQGEISLNFPADATKYSTEIKTGWKAAENVWRTIHVQSIFRHLSFAQLQITENKCDKNRLEV